MKRIGIIALCLAGGLALGNRLGAEEVVLPGNPYAVVVARNIFGLNPPVLVTNTTTVEAPVKIVPNGIMSIFGQLQVLFKVAAKPGGKDASYMLMEGQRQDDIEVVKINEKAAIVTFNNHGIVQELPLVVTAPSSTPAPAPAGGAPAAAGIMPGITPATAATGNNPFNNRFGNRGARGAGGASDASNTRAVPTRGGAAGQQSQMTPEEQAIVLTANKLKAFQEGNPAARIFPPTPLDEEAGLPSNVTK